MLLARSYSHHSLLAAVPKIPDLIADAKQKGYSAVALTDIGTSSGFIEFLGECEKQEMKPVLGFATKLQVTDNISDFCLLAKNREGYTRLLELITVSRTVNEEPDYHLKIDDLTSTENLLFILPQYENEFYHKLINGDSASAEKVLQNIIEKVGVDSLFVELLSSNYIDVDVDKYNELIIKSCEKIGVQYIASPGPRYLAAEQENVYKVVLAIESQKRLGRIEIDRKLNLPSVEDLKTEFEKYPKALNLKHIEDQINIEVRHDYDNNADEAFFPNLEIGEGENYSDRLKWEVYTNYLYRYFPGEKTKEQWRELYPYQKLDELIEFTKTTKIKDGSVGGYTKGYFDEKNTKDYLERLDYELDIIITKGYPSYFLVFADIMSWCRDNDIAVATRGSAAGSLVGYVMDINILDPLVYDIAFERFLNPLRPSAPDIDGDFADDRRGEVIEYIKNKYGQDKVTQIITFGTMLPRAVVRDVGRVIGVSYKKCDALAKMIPNPPQGFKATFDWAFETSDELSDVYDRDDEVREIIDISKQIQGNYRHASSHAAGVIVSPTKMTDYAAVQWDSEHDMMICQYDMKNVEKAGLIKLDILGIRNLAILGNAVTSVEKRLNKDLDLLRIDVDNKNAFEMLANGRTLGIFQLSGGGITRFLVELEPERVQDLMAMVALYRPGPMGNIPEYIKRKKNPKKVEYYVPQMEKWMKDSYGVLVYQDDLLYTVINLAGYDWLEADTFRKGVGKKIKAVIDSQHDRFVSGCVEHSGMSKEESEELWQIIEPFAAYGFNKAHASNYGMIAYWTAYMKAEYTVDFMTSLMTAESNNLDSIGEAISECEELGIEVAPPDVNKSYNTFEIENEQTIRYGLDSVKNLGSDVIKHMIEERQQNGEYKNMEDFLGRMAEFKGFNKRSVEALIWSGSLDELATR